MALVLSPWFGRGCGRRTAPMFAFGSPSLFTDLVIVKVPLHRQPCAAPAAISNARIVQWAETPEAHVFKLRLPGLKKEDLHVQIEDDRILYISFRNQQPKEGEEAGATTSQSKEQTFMRKFKLPETADVEQIKAEVTDETLTVTVPKRKMKAKEPARKIDVSDGAVAPATPSTSTA